jgi:hypothetical protein
MFVKPLALLISNIFGCFRVLWCCRSLHSIHGYKGQNGLKEKFGVPASALERTAVKRKGQDRLHPT